jgi:hypothetical protein
MRNRLELSAPFVHETLRRLALPPHRFTIPVALGLTLQATLEPAAIRLAGATLTVPLALHPGPTLPVRLTCTEFAAPWLWWRCAEVTVAGVAVAVAPHLYRALTHAFPTADTVRQAGPMLGLNLDAALAPRWPVHIRECQVQDGLVLAWKLP